MLQMTLDLFEIILNRTIKSDARVEKHLIELAGRSLYLEITDLKLDLDILLTKNGVCLTKGMGKKDRDTVAQVKVSASSWALLAFLRSKEWQQAASHGFKIEGDMEVASELQHFIQDLEIDWEEILSRYTGDIIARQVFQFAKRTQRKKRDILQSFALSAGNYLQEERCLLPTRVEVEYFNQSVDDLRDNVARIEARLQIVNGVDKNKGMDLTGKIIP